MANVIGSWNGNNIFEYEYEKWKRHDKCNTLMNYGVAYKFHRWLAYNHIIDSEFETVDDTFDNLSECRDDSRYDIHENYKLYEWNNDYDYVWTGMEISFLYVVNGNLWATLEKDGGWFGDIEIGNV